MAAWDGILRDSRLGWGREGWVEEGVEEGWEEVQGWETEEGLIFQGIG